MILRHVPGYAPLHTQKESSSQWVLICEGVFW